MKETLNLPQTEFPMKANLAEREPDFLSRWEKEKIYQKNLHEGPRFILHDGPPYANGSIHFGHILNKVLKDIIVKYKSMSGYSSPYVPGWDCHGLPIELGALKELGPSSNVLEKRKACRQYAHRFIEIQKKQFQRLGIFADWEHPYLTLENQYEADIALEFGKLFLKGYIYQGQKPVHWCASCETALAEAEVEYANVRSPSLYAKFKIKNPELLKLNSPAFFVIWTTTPWTLPANMALAVGENFDYSAYQVKDEVYILASELLSAFQKATGLEGKVLAHFKGEEFQNILTEHPFIERDSPVLFSDHVTLENGTGVVHIAPGHGQEDYLVGQKYKLETFCPVDSKGHLTDLGKARFEEVKKWEGLFIKKANTVILEFLKEKNIQLNDPKDGLEHSYPHCWRCKNPIIFRATAQWFLSLSHNDLRKKTLTAIQGQVKWIPSWGQDRIYGMIESRPDWCLSRQRIWGVPIILHLCVKCEKPFLNEESLKYIYEKFQKEGADAWWTNDEALLPAHSKCECGSSQFQKEKSILDVWFDSGISHAAVLKQRNDLSFPADLYLEGSDQHRGWFHSSLLTSMALNEKAPYKDVLTHGFVVDAAGRKYSKSAKNYQPPEEMINQRGAEILRLWVGAEDYRNDIRFSEEIIKVLSEVYRKIRNTCRFLLGNLYDFDPQKNTVVYTQRSEMDRYALTILKDVLEKVRAAYEHYEFHQVHHRLNKFFTVDLSAFYLDILKDRLYCDYPDSFSRRSAQSTLYDIVLYTIPLLAPILSFTAEEVWSHFGKQSIFLEKIKDAPQEWENKELKARWERISLIRNEVLRALEEARKKKKIGHPLDARVILSAESETLSFLQAYDWRQILIVSQAEIVSHMKGYDLKSEKVKGLTISIEKALGEKCERCWNYSIEASQSSPPLCKRCQEAIPHYS